MTEENNLDIDLQTRREASIAYVNNKEKEAINLLIQRINNTNGNCHYRNWIMLMDIYQMEDQKVPYEHLALLFSNKFNVSPPSWEDIQNNNHKNNDNFTENKNNKKSITQNKGWRNVLIISGSPLDIQKSKEVDFLYESKKENFCKIDLSRMVLQTDNSKQLIKELSALLSLFYHIKKLHCKTLLMGETDLFNLLNNFVFNNKKEDGEHVDDNLSISDLYEREKVYWLLLLEILQWRGEEEQFEEVVDLLISKFEYCPVGYNEKDIIAINPKEKEQKEELNDGGVSNNFIKNADELIKILKENNKKEISIDLFKMKIISLDECNEMVKFIHSNILNEESDNFTKMSQSINQDNLKKIQLSEEEKSKTKVNYPKVSLVNVNEVIFTMFNILGISSVFTILSKYEKLYKKLNVSLEE